jgi:protein transport protein SEC61 subunit gamma-like protein
MDEIQQNPTAVQRLKRFYGECVRVLTVTKKPDSVEYKTIVKVSGLGIALIGVIGFIITMIKQLTLG